MKGNEEETERVADRRARYEYASSYFLYLVISTVCGLLLSKSTRIMTLRFIRDLTELAAVGLSAQQTEN